MRRYIILAALAVASCSHGPTGPDLGQAMNQCGYDQKTYVEAWPCVQEVFSTRRDANPDIQAMFIARGNALWVDAKTGTVTDEKAKALLDVAAAEAMRQETAAWNRRANTAAIAAMAPPVFSTTGIRPQAPQPAPPLISQPVICSRLGASVYCQ